jgi:hypothetical protein
VHAYVRACARVRVRACVHARVRARACVCARALVRVGGLWVQYRAGTRHRECHREAGGSCGGVCVRARECVCVPTVVCARVVVCVCVRARAPWRIAVQVPIAALRLATTRAAAVRPCGRARARRARRTRALRRVRDSATSQRVECCDAANKGQRNATQYDPVGFAF